jgi:hypothetical protein
LAGRADDIAVRAQAEAAVPDVVDTTSLTERIGSENLFPSVRSAVKGFEERAQPGLFALAR